MKRVTKKVLSALLAIIIIATSMPFTAFAVEENTKGNQNVSTDVGDMSLTATNPIAEVITEELEKSSTEETADYVITDLKFNGKVATVYLGVVADCTVVVAIYSEAGQMLATGITTASQGIETVDVTIDIDSMPEYFIAQAFLLDEDYAPLCPEYTTIEEMQCYEEFMEKSVDDFDADDVIINFDEQKDDNFAVLADGSSAVFGSTGKNILVSADYENEIYEFENIDSDISSLSIGDVFYYEYNDEMLIIKVTDIDIKGTSATVTGDKSAELEDYFSFVKVDLSTETDGNDFTVNTEGADEGVEYIGNEKWEEDVLNDEFNTYASIGDAAEISCPVWKLNHYFAGNGNSSNVRLTGQVKASVEYDIKIHYDPWLLAGSIITTGNPVLNDVFSYNAYKSVKAVFDVKVKGTIKLTGELTKDIYLGVYNLPTPVGIICSIGFRLAFSLSAAVTLTIAEISQTIGFDYKKDGEIKNLCTKPHIDITPSLDGKLEGSVGLKISPSISLIKVIGVSINPEVGVKAEMTLFDTEGEKIENHLCKTCFDGELKIYVKVKLVGEIFGENIGDVKLAPEYEKHLADFYYSVTYRDFGWGTCTHVGDGDPDNPVDPDNPDNPDTPDTPDIPDEPDTPNESGVRDSGKCGDNLTWTLYNDGELRIVGTGAMYDYNFYNILPWETYKDQIKSIIIGNGVTTIGTQAFNDCFKLTSVRISDTVTTIGDYSFSWCTNLTSITIPDSVTTIGDCVFYCCVSLADIAVDAENRYYSSDSFGVLYNEKKTRLIQYPIGNERTMFIIPDTVITIGDNAFDDCTSLTSVTIGNSVTIIGNDAFNSCTSLTSVTIGNSVAIIGDGAFYNCSFVSITIPDSVTAVGASAFGGCANLTNIAVDAENQCYSSDSFGVLYNKSKSELIQYPIGSERTSFSIPDSVTAVGDSAFASCVNLTSITIPDSVTTIGSVAFEGCEGLTSITIPDTVTTIGVGSFSWCTNLTSITIPDSVTTLGDYVFQVCDSLTSVTIGNSVTTIGYFAFSGCTNLTSIRIPDSVITIETSAFSNCYSLTSVMIPDSVTTIGYCAFFSCDTLSDVYYGGTYEDWSEIFISSGNEILTGANIHYNSNAVASTYGTGTMLLAEESAENNAYTYSGCVAGNDYIILNIIGSGDDFTLSVDTLLYIDQLTADENGVVETNVLPKYSDPDSVVVLIGDFGNGTEVREITKDEPAPEPEPDPEPEIKGKVHSVSINDISMSYKDSATVTPTINADSGVKYTVSYSSSNNDVVSVDSNGRLTTNDKGSTTITVTVTDENGNTVTDTCNVNVSYKWWQWIIVIVLFGWIWY